MHKITYGVNQQRIKGLFKTGSTTTLTKYYLGNYEEEVVSGNTRKLHYNYGGNGLAAIMEYKNGQENLFYTFTDYQGNLLAGTNTAGTERYAYDPWGARRNPEDWTQPDTRSSLLFSRGYTMHEHLDGFGLINMNGRIYDPLMAQFLSPDPHIQSPENWYNYNRYAYCYNNPLIHNDPSGEFIGYLLAIWGGNYLINSTAYAINNKVSLGTAFKSTPFIGGVGFSPSGFMGGQPNMGFSQPQLDAHLAIKNLIRVSNELESFTSNIHSVWNKMDFVATGDVDFSVGLQIGWRGTLFGGSAEWKLGHSYDIATLNGDLKTFNFSGGWSEGRAHNFLGAKISIKEKFGLGGYYDWTYRVYEGVDGLHKYKGSDQRNWEAIIGTKQFGPKLALIDNLIEERFSINAKIESSPANREFYGIDLGWGMRFLLGVDANVKVGFSY